MTSPFLCTTALEKFWDTNAEKLIFLGRWCLLYDRREQWSGLNHEVLPHPWDDRTAMHQAALTEESWYEAVLAQLTEVLNSAHGEKHETDYWRIIAGPWLLHYIMALHERYLCLRQALDRWPDLDTRVLARTSRLIPRVSGDHLVGSTGDIYNLQLYSILLEAMGMNFGEAEYAWIWESKESSIREPLWKSSLKKIRPLWRSVSPAWAVRGRVLMADVYFSRVEIVRFMAATGFKVRWCEPPEPTAWISADDWPENRSARTSLAEITPPDSDPFTALLIKTLPYALPEIYLEHYKRCRRWAETLIKRARVTNILTATGLDTNDSFKMLTAGLKETGVKVTGVQHGGSYGSALYNPNERLERRAADEYWSWGWGKNEPGVRPMPNPKLTGLASKKSGKTAAAGSRPYALFIGNGLPRYHYRVWSCPVANQNLDYLDWQIRFLQGLSPEVRQDLWFRPDPRSWGWFIRKRIQNECPDIRLDDRSSDFYDRVAGAALVVHDMNQTPLLETLAAGIPTVAFWDPGLWELRPEAEPYFAKLKDAGILHHSVDSAISRVNGLWPDGVERWWSGPAVREAVNNFSSRYAHASPSWRLVWKDALLNRRKGHPHKA